MGFEREKDMADTLGLTFQKALSFSSILLINGEYPVAEIWDVIKGAVGVSI